MVEAQDHLVRSTLLHVQAGPDLPKWKFVEDLPKGLVRPVRSADSCVDCSRFETT